MIADSIGTILFLKTIRFYWNHQSAIINHKFNTVQYRILNTLPAEASAKAGQSSTLSNMFKMFLLGAFFDMLFSNSAVLDETKIRLSVCR